MYISHSFVLSALPLLTLATPVAKSNTSRRVALPPVKDTFDFDPVKLAIDETAHSVETIKRTTVVHQNLNNSAIAHPFTDGNQTLTKRSIVSLPLSDQLTNGRRWYAAVGIGGDQYLTSQKFVVLLDTGAALFIVPLWTCANYEGPKYDPRFSRTCTVYDTPLFRVEFGKGYVVGRGFADHVHIGTLTARDQTFGGGVIYSTGFSAGPGILGLAGFHTPEFGPPLIKTLIDQDDPAGFSLKLTAIDPEISFGTIEELEHLIGTPISWLTVQDDGQWVGYIDNIKVGQTQAVGITRALLDTGAEWFVGDPEGIAAFIREIPGSGQIPDHPGAYYYPCDSVTISVTVAGKEITIPPTSFNNGRYPIPHVDYDTCVPGVYSSQGITSDRWIIGTIFIRQSYTVWDMSRRRIGFADYIARED